MGLNFNLVIVKLKPESVKKMVSKKRSKSSSDRDLNFTKISLYCQADILNENRSDRELRDESYCTCTKSVEPPLSKM